MKKQEADKRRKMWFAVGFAAEVFLVLGVVHEFGHVIAAHMAGARVLRFTWIMVQTSFATPFILAGGYLFELLVYGGLSIIFSKRWSRFGFFCVGAFWAALLTWWISNDREMMIALFDGSVFLWDALVVILGFLLYYTRRYRMWVESPHLMALVTGREDPWRKEAPSPKRRKSSGYQASSQRIRRSISS